ncbi:MAG: restriction endonuclease subunit S [Acidimicrobiia bacterium]|nr:restriction endonuclease subunit S [Acidimicrobiia bacterium]
MRHTSYSSYRPSEVEWLGDIPEHWQISRLRRVARLEAGEGITSEEIDDAGDFPVFGGNGVRGFADRYTHEGEFVLIGRQGALCGNVHLARGKFWASEHAVVATPVDAVSAPWLCRVTDAMKLNQYSTAAAQPGLAVDRISALGVPLPPVDEQRAIAMFLERETAKVDALIAKKHQLIERLAEYRTALITRTVTRGLPPDVAEAEGFDPSPRLKPSGVEWLGDVPDNWEVVENRRIFRERDERSDDGDGELLTVSHITGVTRRSEKPDVGMFMAESLEDYKRCEGGDFIINTMWAWMGAAGTAREPGLVSPSYNVYVPNHQRLMPRFIDLAYRSSRYVLGMTSESRGIWNSRLRLYPQHFLSLVTAVPPLHEQEAIIAYVDAIETRMVRLSEAVGAAIERLQEYRTALTAAAVTGKIDVRDFGPAETVDTGACAI